MYIISQDKNVIFPLIDKGLLKGTVYAEDIYIDEKFYGTNIYGRRLFRDYLLGSYEAGEAEQIITEIYRLMKAGEKFYSMPAPTMDLEDLGVIL